MGEMLRIYRILTKHSNPGSQMGDTALLLLLRGFSRSHPSKNNTWARLFLLIFHTRRFILIKTQWHNKNTDTPWYHCNTNTAAPGAEYVVPEYPLKYVFPVKSLNRLLLPHSVRTLYIHSRAVLASATLSSPTSENRLYPSHVRS